MSEYINNVSRRKEILKSVLKKLHEGKTVDEVKAEFGTLVDEAGSTEIAEVEQMLIEEGLPVEEIQSLCDVHVAVFRQGLDSKPSPLTTPGHPLFTFHAENEVMLQMLDQMHGLVSSGDPGLKAFNGQAFAYLLERLADFNRHYLRKEYLLFPYLEKYGFSGPSKVMWGIHDDIRSQLKELTRLSSSPERETLQAIRPVFAKVETQMREMTYKEEKILFPASLEHLKEADWLAIRQQEPGYGYYMIQPGAQWKPPVEEKDIPAAEVLPPAAAPVEVGLVLPAALLSLNTGALSVAQIDLMLRNLPLDVTFVDEEDTVRYFSQTRERIFDRTAAIIGRKVQNCHPPQSVHKVQAILEDFRSGKRDLAEFWIHLGPRLIHIRYFALRDPEGKYRGTLEVSQDITHIQELRGDRRLLDD